MTKIAKGRQGDWFATTTKTGERLPCLKAHFLGARGAYHERWFYDPSQRRNAEYIEAIKLGRVLISPYKPNGTRQGTRNGYLNYIYTVDNVRHDEDGLRCRIIAKEAV